MWGSALRYDTIHALGLNFLPGFVTPDLIILGYYCCLVNPIIKVPW